ncbi:MAG: hypothetical protein Q9215_002773 [Flavoplaca cf. flavocitrina]
MPGPEVGISPRESSGWNVLTYRSSTKLFELLPETSQSGLVRVKDGNTPWRYGKTGIKFNQGWTREFIKSDTSSVERYIETWPAVDFQIEVYFSREFKSELGFGITVGIKLDGGATHGYHLTKAQINRYQMSGSPIVFEGIEKSPTERVAFRFGPMNENIDWALGDPDSHIPDFGTIEVEVLRIKLKRNGVQSEQPPSATTTTPRKVVGLSGQEMTERRETDKLALRRKKRSAPPILNSPGFVYGSDEKMEPARLSFLYRHGLTYQLEAIGRVHPVGAEMPSAPATNSEKYMYTSKDFKILAEKVDRVEEQLKESQQQTAALMEKLVGEIHSTIQTALERRPTGSVSTPAHSSGVKRKRNTDEVSLVEKRAIDPSSRNYYGD